MNADMRSTSPMIVDIWFLKVSLPCSHRPRSPVSLFSNATLLSTCSIPPSTIQSHTRIADPTSHGPQWSFNRVNKINYVLANSRQNQK